MKYLFLIATTLLSLYGAEYSTSSSWLIDLNSTPAQMEGIQKQFRGFDTAMMEVGYRFEATKKAIDEGNYPLASYHWEKIKTAMDNGTIRRPARKESSNLFFLDSIHPTFSEVLKSGNTLKIRSAFTTVKSACNACHVDQKVGFIIVK